MATTKRYRVVLRQANTRTMREVDLMANNQEDAIKKAKKMYKNKMFFVKIKKV